jgi:CheY-like chemotaxis protein
MGDKLRFLVADDCIVSIQLHLAKLAARGHCCDYVLTGEEAMDKLLTRDYDGIVTDNKMPGFTGVELAQMTRPLFKPGELPMFIVTSDHRETLGSDLFRLHDVMVFAKPITAPQVDRIIAVTYAARELRRARREAHKTG